MKFQLQIPPCIAIRFKTTKANQQHLPEDNLKAEGSNPTCSNVLFGARFRPLKVKNDGQCFGQLFYFSSI